MMCKKCLVHAWYIMPTQLMLTIFLNPSQMASPPCPDPVAAGGLLLLLPSSWRQICLLWFVWEARMKNVVEGVRVTLWREQGHWRWTNRDLILFVFTYYHLHGLGQVSLPPWASVSSLVKMICCCEDSVIAPVLHATWYLWQSRCSVGGLLSPVLWARFPLPFPVLCIAVTPHILLLPPGAPQSNLWKLFSTLWKRKSAIHIKNFPNILFGKSLCSLLSRRLATLMPEIPRHCSWVRNLK